eukprot:scaffold124674_cov32-Tisochrysis_lutea.AAC.2
MLANHCQPATTRPCLLPWSHRLLAPLPAGSVPARVNTRRGRDNGLTRASSERGTPTLRLSTLVAGRGRHSSTAKARSAARMQVAPHARRDGTRRERGHRGLARYPSATPATRRMRSGCAAGAPAARRHVPRTSLGSGRARHALRRRGSTPASLAAGCRATRDVAWARRRHPSCSTPALRRKLRPPPPTTPIATTVSRRRAPVWRPGRRQANRSNRRAVSRRQSGPQQYYQPRPT